MSAKHTPTPWEIETEKKRATKAGPAVFVHTVQGRVDGVRSTVCRTHSVDGVDHDAEFIVRACNAHDDLLEALRELVRQVEVSEAVDPMGHALKDLQALADARAAIAKAGAK